MEGKTCIVTGANSGIGRVTARELAARGARVVMICRDPERAAAAQREIIEHSGNAAVELLIADLAQMAQVRRAAAAFRERHATLDVLLNNAGVFLPRRQLTPDGYEATFAINHLAPFLLTQLLLEPLGAAPAARVVTVSSEAHRGGRIDFDDLHAERYRGFGAYCASKLANILFTYELARRLGEQSTVTANCLHPGTIGSGFAQDERGKLQWMMKTFSWALSSSETGARTSLYLATAPELEQVSGKYFSRCKPRRSSGRSRDEGVARRLWEVSAQLTGV